MADQEHLNKLKGGVAIWNQWRTEHRGIHPDLSNADLSDANLSDADLSRVDLRYADLSRVVLKNTHLSGADLSNAHLNYTNLSGADLRYADLSNADLGYAHLSGADLRYAHLSDAKLDDAKLFNTNLRYADLSGADLSRTDLSGADLSEANLFNTNLSSTTCGNTIFADVDLQTIKGLGSVNHIGPSILTLHNIHLPQDGNALHFLRGVGIPDEWIDFYRATMMHPIQYYSCFISYSSKDQVFAERLYADLQSKNVRCWYAPHHMKIGEKIIDRIDESIRIYDKLLLILSRDSVESHWVEHEVGTALDKEREGHPNILFPVRIDETIMGKKIGWANHVRNTRHIGDFTQWKEHDVYQYAFQRLLHDLKQGI